MNVTVIQCRKCTHVRTFKCCQLTVKFNDKTGSAVYADEQLRFRTLPGYMSDSKCHCCTRGAQKDSALHSCHQLTFRLFSCCSHLQLHWPVCEALTLLAASAVHLI